jgi:lantibiotic modifying enzyme
MSSDGAAFLEVADGLAHKIAKLGIWYEGRCNWMGAVHPEHSLVSGRPAIEALGPDLYGGTSGVALFLAAAGVKLDDQRLRATALGAIRHALDHADGIDGEVRDGLYGGSVGVVYAATCVAEMLDAKDVTTRARELLNAWHRDPTRSVASDVMSGCSGAVIGLAALGQLVDEPWLLDAATTLGEELIRRAEVTPEGWSWPAPGPRVMHNLCGYLHGAAGPGHAFLELFDWTGSPRFRRAGERAFEYERSWIDRGSGTWPDLRGIARSAGRAVPLSTSESWCNGATGIAVSRLRATELVGSVAVKADADLALANCERHACRLLAQEPGDFSLCHGAAGLCDVLLYAADGPNDRRARLAADVGRWGIEREGRRGEAGFACGVPGGETPGLQLGLAGIGLFYLRLFDPQLSSPLLVQRKRLDSPAGQSLQSKAPGEGECRARARP